MKLAIAGDSAGGGLAKVLADHLKHRFDVAKISRISTGADPFCADLSDRVASRVADGTFDRAILVCGTGIGVCISANKVPGIRAALTHDTYSAERAALSNNAHIITLCARVIGGARVIGSELAKAIADASLAQTFNYDPEGRSFGNVGAVDAVDARYNSVDPFASPLSPAFDTVDDAKAVRGDLVGHWIEECSLNA